MKIYIISIAYIIIITNISYIDMTDKVIEKAHFSLYMRKFWNLLFVVLGFQKESESPSPKIELIEKSKLLLWHVLLSAWVADWLKIDDMGGALELGK